MLTFISWKVEPAVNGILSFEKTDVKAIIMFEILSIFIFYLNE